MVTLWPSKEDLKSELLTASLELSARGLCPSALWCAEQAHAIDAPLRPSATLPYFYADMPFDEVPKYVFAKTLFDHKEYLRVVYFLESCSHPKCVYLRLYALLIDGETRREGMPVSSVLDHAIINHLKYIRQLLMPKAEEGSLDGYMWYILGVVNVKMQVRYLYPVNDKQALINHAKLAFINAVKLEPMLYAAWWELAQLIGDKVNYTKINNNLVKFFQ